MEHDHLVYDKEQVFPREREMPIFTLCQWIRLESGGAEFGVSRSWTDILSSIRLLDSDYLNHCGVPIAVHCIDIPLTSWGCSELNHGLAMAAM